MKPDIALTTSGSMLIKTLVLLLVSAIAIIVWQHFSIASIEETSRQTHWKVMELEQLQSQVAEIPKLRALAAETESLRRNNQELNRLRNEVGTLRSKATELEQMAVEVQRLRAALAEAQLQTKAVASEAQSAVRDAAILMAQAEEQCVNQLKQIGLAGRMWADKNNQTLPQDFVSMFQELGVPTMLVCPSDPSRQAVGSWELLKPGGISYVLKGPGNNVADASRVFVECPIHGHVCLADGSVHKGEIAPEN